MRHELVETAIEGVALGDREVFPQQIPHGAARVPAAMEAPFAARVDEAIGHQRLEHV